MNVTVSETASITGKGPVSGVQVHHHMQFGPQAVIVPLDLTLLVQLMFMLAEQARRSPEDERLVVTPQSLMERLRSLGVVSGNGSRLVGRDAVYESFARLTVLGYIRRLEPRDGGKRVGPVAYEFYEWPAWNPDPAQMASSNVLASPQVGATSGNAGSGNAGSSKRKRTNQSSSQVGATSGNAGSGNAGSSGHERTFPQVGATSGIAGSPPHPPEEVDTSSPNPLKPATTGEEEVRFADEDLTAASRLLQTLPLPWAVGRPQGKRLGPKLLEAMRDQGWPQIGVVDRRLLVGQLTKNPDGVHSHARVLEKDRIANLPLFEVVAASRQSPQAGSPSRAPHCGHADCDPIGRTRDVRDENGGWIAAPCPVCHPSAAGGATAS